MSSPAVRRVVPLCLLALVALLLVTGLRWETQATVNLVDNPEFIADAPWRVEPGQDVPIFLAVRYADSVVDVMLWAIDIRVNGNSVPVPAFDRNRRSLASGGRSVELNRSGYILINTTT